MRTAALALLYASLSFGYIRATTALGGDAAPVPLYRTDNTGIQFLMNQSITPGATSPLSGTTVISANSNPVAAVRAALATWNAVGTANVKFLPLQSTSLGIAGDGSNVIAIAATADDLSVLGGLTGALAITALHYRVDATSGQKGVLAETDVIINPGYPFSTDGSTPYDLQSGITHELGHALGANHTSLFGASMYWANFNQRFLTTDDTTFVSTVYPRSSGGLVTGTLAGTVTAGGQPVAFAMISLFDPALGTSEGTLTADDGTWSVQVPPGNYRVIVEPLTGVIQPPNLYLNLTQTGQSKAVPFQPTLVPGAATVIAGNTTVLNITANNTAPAMAVPLVSATAVNGAPGLGYMGGPVTIQSGQAVDLILDGAGYDASLTDSSFQIIGSGITLKPGSVRVDPNLTFKGVAALRVTLNVAPGASQYLASIFITSGASNYSLTGALVVTPPTPQFTPQSAVSAASYAGGVSPGGYQAIFASPATSGLGPATGVLNAGFDAYGMLPTDLAGVRVTFDGVPAPLFYVSGAQINLQAPFEVAGKTTTKVVVNYLGSPSAAVTVPVVAEQPAFFTGLVVNQDGTTNTAQNPAARGSYVTIYGTGVGQSSYTFPTGAAAPPPPAAFSGGWTISIGTQTVNALFGGWTPSAVALAQWNVQIPPDAATGPQALIATDTATGAATPQETIFIK